MELIEVIILAIVQGITEWLPISSSGHLVIFQQLFNIQASVEFNLILHIGTLLAVVVFFREKLIKILKDFFTFDFKKKNAKMGLWIIFATIPIVIIGFFFKDFFEYLFTNMTIVSIALIFTGIILLLTKTAKTRNKLNIKNSFLIGVAQALAIIPGISRSGITISTGMLAGVKKQEVAEFSFILSIPALIGAVVLKLNDFVFGFEELVGLIVSFVVGYLTIAFLLNIIKKGKFWLFGIYCLLLGLFLFFF